MSDLYSFQFIESAASIAFKNQQQGELDNYEAYLNLFNKISRYFLVACDLSDDYRDRLSQLAKLESI